MDRYIFVKRSEKNNDIVEIYKDEYGYVHPYPHEGCPLKKEELKEYVREHGFFTLLDYLEDIGYVEQNYENYG